VDPNYATKFTAVPKTFFINEHGVVQPLEEWEERLVAMPAVEPVTAEIRAHWSSSESRLAPQALARLVEALESDPDNLAVAVDLASRYLDLRLAPEAAKVLRPLVDRFDPRSVARSPDKTTSELLGQAYFQLSRALMGDRRAAARYATLSFFLNPSVGYGKQIARVIAPEKFDHRPGGEFDNEFREGTLRRLRREREAWLKGDMDNLESE
jgi:hypothetical protein